MFEWHSVKERLPSEKEVNTDSLFLCRVLLPNGNGGFDVSYSTLHAFVDLCNDTHFRQTSGIITHWCIFERPIIHENEL